MPPGPVLSTPIALAAVGERDVACTFFVDAGDDDEATRVFAAHTFAGGLIQVTVGPSTTVSFFCRNAVFGMIVVAERVDVLRLLVVGRRHDRASSVPALSAGAPVGMPKRTSPLTGS